MHHVKYLEIEFRHSLQSLSDCKDKSMHWRTKILASHQKKKKLKT